MSSLPVDASSFMHALAIFNFAVFSVAASKGQSLPFQCELLWAVRDSDGYQHL